MTGAAESTGYFLFTLDTELAWGYFDSFHPEMFSPDGSRERANVLRVLDLLEEINLAATWALVGHLFYGKCEECAVCPVRDWQGKYESYSHVYGASSPLWYGADMIQALLERAGRHEIAFHGYTHRIFDPATLDEEEARVEIAEWRRVAARWNVRQPTTVVFPRNRLGHLEVFAQNGFNCYRGRQLMPPDYYSLPLLGKALNRIDLITQLRTPQVYSLPAPAQGMVNLPSSRGLLRVNPRFEMLLARLGLEHLPTASLIRGVEKAAREKKVVHLYVHEWDFRGEMHFEKLRQVFAAVAEKVRAGQLQSITMGALARQILDASGGA
jgi:hypothetical protein